MVKLLGYKFEKEELIRIHQNHKISIWLDSYDDIFSDFDPGPYNQRHISEDFYNQLRKFGVEEMNEHIEIDLVIDEKKKEIQLLKK